MLVGLYGGFERPVGEVLQPQIDAGSQVLAVTRRPNTLDVLNRAAQPVLQHALCTGLTAQPVVERKLQTFLTFVVNIGKPDQVTGNFRRRVVTTVFALHVDPWQLQRKNLLRLFGTQVPLQIKKLFIHAARDATHERLRINAQRLRQLRHVVDRRANSFGFAQILSTGVLIASGSPLRSVIVPRCAEIFSVRR